MRETRVGGRVEGRGKRLAENAFKMAEQSNFRPYANEDFEDVRSTLAELERPTDNAIRAGKVLCPESGCANSLCFFERNEIVHHFGVEHNSKFTEQDHLNSTRISRNIHEQEIKGLS